MVIFDEPLYLSGRSTQSHVYVGEKPDDIAKADFQKGLARMGGFWRRPSYFESYLTSAELLIEQGRLREDYDDIGLPAFYLQRHATELLLKRLLSWCIDIVEMRAKVSPAADYQVPSKCKNALNKNHNLRVLLKATKQMAKKAGEDPPPEKLTDLVEALISVEESDHWSRYDHRYSHHQGKKIFHHGKVATIPVVKLQVLLNEVANLTVSRSMNDATYENGLYSTYTMLMHVLDELSMTRGP